MRLFTLTLVAGLVAEERGRLPNGSAFRTDENGTQLVDYIAELEVTNESLESQMRTMQAELNDLKQRRSSNVSEDSKLKERDLVAIDRKPVAPKLLEVSDVTKCPSCACPATPNCDAAIAEHRASWSASKGSADTVANERAAQVAKLSDELHMSKAQNINYQQQVSTLKSDLLKRGDELSALQKELNIALSTIRSSKDESVRLAKENTTLRSEVTLAKSGPGTASAVTARQPRASLAVAKTLAVDSVRGQLKSDVNQLTSMIRLRDRRFAEYANLDRAVRLSPVAAKSARGLDINDVSRRIKGAQGIYELSQLKRDLTEINSKVQDDLVLIERMMKNM